MIKLRIIIRLVLFLFMLNPLIPAQAQDDVALFNYWQYYSDIENSLYKHFCSVASEQLESRKKEISGLNTKSDWLERQSMVRQKLSEIIGPFPEKTPLNAKVTGMISRDGYSIEKIVYEPIPGYYVTGALYIPDGIREKAPAIFYACGHSVERIQGRYVSAYLHQPGKKRFCGTLPLIPWDRESVMSTGIRR